MNIAILTDTNSGIFPAEGQAHGIHVLPMPVILDGKTYYEGVNLTAEAFYKHLEQGGQVSTSQPAPGDVLSLWEGLLAGFENLGPLVPILLAAVESFFPPLPLVAIVALNVAAHGGVLGFLYSWMGVAAGGTIMFLLWRRVFKRFFWKLASRSRKLERAQQWVNHFDTASLFMLALLPFAPTSFMHFAFGMSDMDEGHYLRTVLLGKGAMVGMMAVFGQSLLSSLRNPGYLVLAIAIWGGMYWVSKQFCKKHDIN